MNRLRALFCSGVARANDLAAARDGIGTSTLTPNTLPVQERLNSLSKRHLPVSKTYTLNGCTGWHAHVPVVF